VAGQNQSPADVAQDWQRDGRRTAGEVQVATYKQVLADASKCPAIDQDTVADHIKVAADHLESGAPAQQERPIHAQAIVNRRKIRMTTAVEAALDMHAFRKRVERHLVNHAKARKNNTVLRHSVMDQQRSCMSWGAHNVRISFVEGVFIEGG
jgi:hypothetical protein